MYYLLMGVVLYGAELLYFKLADTFGIIDKPNERSSHTRITLRGGGIIFYVGVLLYFIFSGFPYIPFVLALSLITCISFVDDLRPISQKLRLAFHFVAMGLLFWQWQMVQYPWWFIGLALIVCTGIINAYNFMDGINGITGGYSLVVLLFLAYVNDRIVAFADPALIYTVLLSLIVFNIFNFRRHARCFAGDVGSVGMAFIVIFCLGSLMIATQDLSWIIVLIVYGVDCVLTIFHRLWLRENIGLPHRKHLYQIMANELAVPHRQVALLYMVVQSVINIGYIYARLQGYTWIYFFLCLLGLTVGYLWFMRRYFHLHSLAK